MLRIPQDIPVSPAGGVSGASSGGQRSSWGCAVLGAATGNPGSDIHDQASLTRAFEAALLGNTPEIDARDRAVRARLIAQGVRIVQVPEDEIPLDITYRFRKPLVILGQTVFTVRLEGDSGSTFAAETRGDIDRFIARMKLRRIDRTAGNERHILGDYFRWTRPPTPENPYPDAIFLQVLDRRQGRFRFGLQTFDY